jgi:hypothetical protein
MYSLNLGVFELGDEIHNDSGAHQNLVGASNDCPEYFSVPPKLDRNRKAQSWR